MAGCFIFRPDYGLLLEVITHSYSSHTYSYVLFITAWQFGINSMSEELLIVRGKAECNYAVHECYRAVSTPNCTKNYDYSSYAPDSFSYCSVSLAVAVGSSAKRG